MLHLERFARLVKSRLVFFQFTPGLYAVTRPAEAFSNARAEFKRMFEAEARNFERISTVITEI
jgi:hypothetical protein